MTALKIKVVTGTEILPYIDALADLRTGVFRAWPYLYDGTLKNEQTYLQGYASCPHSVMILALDKDAVVGASTAVPLKVADPNFRNAFTESDYPVESVLYLAESALLSSYRGRGIGHQFFDAREKHAVSIGAHYTAFCAVERPSNDPRRPKDYQDLDAFWKKRGYTNHPEIRTNFDWRDVGDSVESAHSLSFWIKKP